MAVSDSFTVTIKITARVKLEVRRALEERGVKSNLVMIRMFVGAIARIGRQSPAHRAAIQVMRRQAKADLIPTASELLEVC